MTDPKVLEYFDKKRLVFRRQNNRVLVEFRIYFLEEQFRSTNRLLEPIKWETIEIQLGEAYKELMALRRVKNNYNKKGTPVIFSKL